MIKNIIKEGIIVLIILIAIALILSILLYEYIPSNKTVPVAIQEYELPEEIKNDLSETINEEQANIVKTLYIGSSDLDRYESSKEYNKGKANPFADYSVDEGNTSNNSSTTGGSANTSNSNNNSNKDDEDENDNEVFVSTPGKNY